MTTEAVKLNYENMMAERLGESGIQEAEITVWEAPTKVIHKELETKRESGEIGFYQLPYQDDLLDELEAYGAEQQGKFDNLVILGIGGSALGNIALRSALCHPYYNLLHYEERDNQPRLFVLDNIDPVRINGLLDVLELDKTLWCVITKSGSTAETMSQFLLVRQLLQEEMGADEYKNNLVYITDPKNGALRESADRDGIRAFEIPANVGGRFSVMTPVGLLSGALTGIDIRGFLAGAAAMDERCKTPDLKANPAYLNAVLQYLSYQKGRNLSVMLPYSHQLRDMSDWYRQLWAESLGKRFSLTGEEICVGPTPIKALGVTDQHSQMQLYLEGPDDKVITFLSVEKFESDVEIPKSESESLAYLGGHTFGDLFKAEEKATRRALTDNGRPNCDLIIPEVSAHTLGQLMFLLMTQTAFSGALYQINPFDQPAVELGKKYTYGLMGRAGFEKERELIEGAEDFGSRFIL